MRVLLVEPNYSTGIPPIALLKISTMLKAAGHKIMFAKGKLRAAVKFRPEEIWITTFATYHHRITIETILFYLKSVPKAKVRVGGIFASLMPEYIEKHTGVRPHVGLLEKAEAVRPDYSLIESDMSIAYTSRGCIRHCPWCVVPRIEGKTRAVKGWERMIDVSKPKIFLLDNNWLSKGLPALKKDAALLRDMVKKGVKEIDVNPGLDARLFTEKVAKALAGIPFRPIRFAFDDMSIDGVIQTAIARAQAAGFAARQEWCGSGDSVAVYALYNHEDRPQDFYYRMKEIIRCGAQCYPMQFSPHEDLERNYVGRHWTRLWRDNVRTICTNTSYGRGSVSPNNRDQFEGYWGGNEAEFMKIISRADARKRMGAIRDKQKIDRIRMARAK